MFCVLMERCDGEMATLFSHFPSAFLDIEICHRGGRRDRISVVGRMLGVKGAHHRAPHVALHVTILFLYYFLLFFTTINILCAAMC